MKESHEETNHRSSIRTSQIKLGGVRTIFTFDVESDGGTLRRKTSRCRINQRRWRLVDFGLCLVSEVKVSLPIMLSSRPPRLIADGFCLSTCLLWILTGLTGSRFTCGSSDCSEEATPLIGSEKFQDTPPPPKR